MGCVCPGVREGLEATAAPPYLGLFGDLPPDDPGGGELLSEACVTNTMIC